jgi:hypothetical protein
MLIAFVWLRWSFAARGSPAPQVPGGRSRIGTRCMAPTTRALASRARTRRSCHTRGSLRSDPHGELPPL